MRYPPTVAGVHWANNLFPGFFRGENFDKLHLNGEKNHNMLQPGMFFCRIRSSLPALDTMNIRGRSNVSTRSRPEPGYRTGSNPHFFRVAVILTNRPSRMPSNRCYQGSFQAVIRGYFAVKPSNIRYLRIFAPKFAYFGTKFKNRSGFQANEARFGLLLSPL